MNQKQLEHCVLGQKIVIQEGPDAELATLALHLVEKKLANIAQSRPLLGPQQTAVLALLELAGDLIKDRAAMDQYRSELDQRCTSLMSEMSKFQSERSQARA